MATNRDSKKTARRKTSRKRKTGAEGQPKEVPINLPFNKDNYVLMGGSLLLVILGFILMYGGTENIYSFRRIHLSSIVVMSGYFLMIYAILKKNPELEEKNTDNSSSVNPNS